MRALLPALVFAWALAATGCADPAGAFEAFVERDQKARAEPDAGSAEPDAAAGVLPAAEQVSGLYQLAVSSVLDPAKPFVYLLEVEATPEGAGLRLRMRDQPLSYEDRATPVGERSSWRTISVGEDGRYIDSLVVDTPGAANPILPGRDIKVALMLKARLADAELPEPEGPVAFWCGDVDGMLIEPLTQSIDGSTFTIARVGDRGPSREVVINCQKEQAEPLP